MVAFVAAIFFMSVRNSGLHQDVLVARAAANENAAELVKVLDERDAALLAAQNAAASDRAVGAEYEKFKRNEFAGGCVVDVVGSDVAGWVFQYKARDGP